MLCPSLSWMPSRRKVIMTDPAHYTNIPLIQTTEQRLNKIRMRLEDAFSKLKLAHDASIVCRAACEQTSTDCDEEVATVLFRIVTHHIDMEMRTISVVIEELGGRTEFTEGSEKLKDLYDRVNGEGKYATNGHSSEDDDEQ